MQANACLHSGAAAGSRNWTQPAPALFDRRPPAPPSSPSPIERRPAIGYDDVVQLRLPWDLVRVARGRATPPRALVADGRPFPLEIVRHARARRYLLRLAPGGIVRLTVPRGASVAGGVRFAETQTDWILREWRRQEAAARPWTTGSVCWFRGERVTLTVSGATVRCGTELVRIASGETDVRAAVEAHWRALATRELSARCVARAETVGVTLARVSVRNQRSRWGACSARGVITLNWRLIQMPPTVADYVICHELAHLRHANHSRRFWREVERLDPNWRAAERWLRAHGREIL